MGRLTVDDAQNCRFGDGPAAQVFYTPAGCFVYPDDRTQALCPHHILKGADVRRTLIFDWREVYG